MPWPSNRSYPESAKEKLRLLQLGRKRSIETRLKISAARKGKGHKHTQETKEKIRQLKRGTVRSEETKLKLSIIASKRIGNKNPNWKGGILTNKQYQLNRKLKNYSDRRAKLNSAEGSYTVEEWENLKYKYKNTCPMCGRKEPEVKLTQDHIIPISIGGTNYITNIQPLCKSCNCKKNIKSVKINPKGQYELCLR
jgi:hypothetical protein